MFLYLRLYAAPGDVFNINIIITMYISTVTISSKGQIVLPKRIRTILNSNTVSLLVNDQNQVLLTPINTLEGALSSYNKSTNLSFAEIREQSWNDSIPTKIHNSNEGNK